MIGILNRLVAHIEQQLESDLNISDLLRGDATTEYHMRRMFSSLAGMPLSE